MTGIVIIMPKRKQSLKITVDVFDLIRLRKTIKKWARDKNRYKRYKKPKWLIKAERELERAIETGEYDKWLLEQLERYEKKIKNSYGEIIANKKEN